MAVRNEKGEPYRETYGPEHFTVNCPSEDVYKRQAQHKTSRVPRRGGNGKAGNGGVFYKRRILQHIGQTAQPAAQDLSLIHI